MDHGFAEILVFDFRRHELLHEVFKRRRAIGDGCVQVHGAPESTSILSPRCAGFVFLEGKMAAWPARFRSAPPTFSIANNARAKSFGGRRGQQVHDTATERAGALRRSLRMASSSGAKPQGKTGAPFQGVTARKLDARPSRRVALGWTGRAPSSRTPQQAQWPSSGTGPARRAHLGRRLLFFNDVFWARVFLTGFFLSGKF